MIDKKDVEYAAGLAHLKLDEEEKEKYTEQIGEILDYVDKLSELDTDDVVPTAYTVPMKNVLRKDEVKKSLPRENHWQMHQMKKMDSLELQKLCQIKQLRR